jgi:hypothetical protein
MKETSLAILTSEGSLVVEISSPYRMSFITPKSVRAATPCEIFAALLVLRQNGKFGILRLLAIFVRKLTMSLLRSSQQQLFTPTEITPELLSTFKRWEKEMEGSHDLPQ